MVHAQRVAAEAPTTINSTANASSATPAAIIAQGLALAAAMYATPIIINISPFASVNAQLALLSTHQQATADAMQPASPAAPTPPVLLA